MSSISTTTTIDDFKQRLANLEPYLIHPDPYIKAMAQRFREALELTIAAMEQRESSGRQAS